MRNNDARGGRPHMHAAGKRTASADICRGLHPRQLGDWTARLRGLRATRVRAELQAAVEWGVLEYDEAEWIYQQLRVGKGWYCLTLDQGRGWNPRRHAAAQSDDPTIPRWWFNR